MEIDKNIFRVYLTFKGNRISATAVLSGGHVGGPGCRCCKNFKNRAARIVTNSSYDSSASALIKSLNWPTVADMIKTETACMVYKSINDLLQITCQNITKIDMQYRKFEVNT
eukprot:TRINITY_DN6921_c0_g1_i1.p2 TRINITY_DN6921_c0_g1~~TRINITY_DN6921_c0_g1_i1.p2  ORF type:complete len:112 (-),score=0.61 TRINITY_DN6921_c0_g1_i1:54-389(-)